MPPWIHERDGSLREASLRLRAPAPSGWTEALGMLFGRGQLTVTTAMPPEFETRLRAFPTLTPSEQVRAVAAVLGLRSVTLDFSIDGRMFRFYLWDPRQVAFDMLPDPSDPAQLATFVDLCESLSRLLDLPVTIRHEHGDHPAVTLSV